MMTKKPRDPPRAAIDSWIGKTFKPPTSRFTAKETKLGRGGYINVIGIAESKYGKRRVNSCCLLHLSLCRRTLMWDEVLERIGNIVGEYRQRGDGSISWTAVIIVIIILGVLGLILA